MSKKSSLGLLAIILITAAVLFIIKPASSPDQSDIETNSDEMILKNQEAAWDIFVTSGAESLNVSFDMPAGSEIFEGGTDTFTAFEINRDGKTDAMIIVFEAQERGSFIKTIGGSEARVTESERGAMISNTTFHENSVIANTQTMNEDDQTPISVFVPPIYESLAAAIIDIEADWSPEMLDHVARSLVFQKRW